MQPKIAILELDPDGGETAKVHWRSAQGSSHAIPDVKGFWQLNLDDAPGEGPAEARAAAGKEQGRLSELAAVLGWPAGAVQAAAISESFTTAGGGLQTNAFVQTQLQGHSYWLRTRGSDSIGRGSNLAAVQFVTGACLFSNRALTAVADDDSVVDLLHPGREIRRRLVSIDAQPELSFYELESCARQARLICDLAQGWPGLSEFRVTIDVPREQYYCYLLKGLADGLVDRDLMMHWVVLVDARFDQVVAQMGDELLEWSRRAGLPVPKINLATGFEGLRESLVAAITDEHEPELDTLTRQLAARSETWGRVSRMDPPTTLRELINLSYAVDYVRAQGGDTVLVAVEDRSEYRIIEAAEDLSLRLRPGEPVPMVGLYALEQAFIAGHDNWSLYLNDPGTHFRDHGHRLTARELVKKIHGADA